ncbi:hypothetical protein Trydic_g18006 [Trypoxylus dichotomus]
MSTLAIFLLIFCIPLCYGEELICILNGKKYLNFVSDKFLSFTVDPVVLLSGINIGSSTRQLAKHLSPAYIKISGPSTEYLEYVEHDSMFKSDDSGLSFTSTMWRSLNDWFLETGLTPIFTINDDNGGSETKLSTKTIFPLLEVSDRLDMKCLWQVDYEIHGKNLAKYIEELKAFKYILSAFRNGNQNWKIIGPDISHWIGSGSPDEVKRLSNSFENLTEAVIWTGSDNCIPKSIAGMRLPIWLQIPKSQSPITFKSAIDWAKIIGETASIGYELIFREPRLFEIIADTPVFWLTLFHKKLTGRNVLELKPGQSIDGRLSAYCHCARNQNDFLRRGAITVLVINYDIEERTIALKMSTVTSKNCEIRNYILTTDFEESTSTFLNGQKLNLNMLKDNIIPQPKIRRAKAQKFLTLEAPPKSLAFFVIPDARVPICISNEDDTNFIIQEINEDQDKDFEERYQTEINARFQEPVASLNDLYLMMEKELEDDENYYALDKGSVNHQSESWKNVLAKKNGKITSSNTVLKNVAALSRPFMVSRIDIRKRMDDMDRKKTELMQKISDKTKILRTRLESNNTEDCESDFNSELVTGTTHASNRATREAKGGGRGRGRGRHGGRKTTHTTPASPKIMKKINHKLKRDINMELLEQKLKETKQKGAKKLDTRENKRSHSKKQSYRPIVQPEFLYKKDESSESMDITDFLNNIREKSGNLDLSRKYKDKGNAKPKITFTKINRGDTKKKIGKHEEKGAPKIESASGDFDLDYLVDDEYSDISYESRESPNSKNFDQSKSIEDSLKFPIRPTFKVKKQHMGHQGHKPVYQQDWLNREVFIENSKDIEEAIKALDDYLNHEDQHRDAAMEDINFSMGDYYDDIDYGDLKSLIRYKRDENHGYTEDDIRYYKLLMSSNIRHMRENMLKQKSKALSARKEIKPITLGQKLQIRKLSRDSEAPAAVSSIGRERSFEELPKKLPNHRRLKGGFRLLKNRLAQHKTVTDTTSKAPTTTPRAKKVEEVDEETKQLIKMIKNELKNRRSISAGIKRHKRYIAGSSNKFNKDLGDAIDSVSKDLNYLIPDFDDTKISLIFPSKDEISFSNSEDGAEISYKHFKEHEDEGLGTCPLVTIDFDLTTETTSMNQTEKLVTTGKDVEALEHLNRAQKLVKSRLSKEPKLMKNVTHIQKIGKKDDMHIIDKVFKSITDFVEDMHAKIKSYITIV